MDLARSDFALPTVVWLAGMHQRLVDDHPLTPILVIGGTARVDVGREVNQAVLWTFQGIPGQASEPGEFVCTKTNPAVQDLATEDIENDGRTIRLFATDRFLLAVMICRDILSADMRAVLKDFGANLLLVPAMSQKSRSLVDAGCEIVTGTQAVFVLGNAPLRWPDTVEETRAQAAMHGPYGLPGGPIEVPPALPALEEAGVILFDVFDRSVSVPKG